MIKVLAVKNGETLGWFKDLQAGINSILESSKVNNFDIKDYELRDMEDGIILWSGRKYTENNTQAV
jgi:hypothetical protein